MPCLVEFVDVLAEVFQDFSSDGDFQKRVATYALSVQYVDHVTVYQVTAFSEFSNSTMKRKSSVEVEGLERGQSLPGFKMP